MVLHELAFQFTPLREGRHRKKMRKRALHDFNSRPSARGDGLQCGIILSGQTFQFTPLREGRRAQYWFPVPEVFQFTPLREGRPHPGARRFHFSISIHAPPRGATRYEVTDAASGEFQFTPLREGRPNAFSTLSVLVYFNSRPSARGDGASSSSTGGAALFQFTPLREGRPEMPDYWLRAPGYFNSRPSARGDRAAERRRLHPRISIHAPPRGATITKVNHTCR